ncbi:uncharacterized protein LOC113037835 isoform X2 [Carassius auratus]|uniref:Uncharacterized protein LOC113037835 isoform X2 n=1 Tax=Carassius auratus TaxID=7957 RepID=A0A6P6IT41_CARAU|nr:uncharacterized protein LOC113037835 isoform X2 [Carassius auratus]
MLRFDLYSWIEKEYHELLRKAEKIFSRLECWPNIYSIYLKDDDAWSNPKDHLHMFDELIVSNNKLSTFERLGNVHALGISDLHPLLVLVEINQAMDTAPPLYIDDDYHRAFELQFLLMTRTSLPTHMIVGLNLFDRWILYDNSKLPFDHFNPKNADFRGDFTILLIGYVNVAPR